jgi:hypothetical protein
LKDRPSTATYTVLVDEHSYYQDERERYEHGAFATCDEAILACQHIVDAFLARQYQPGMMAAELYRLYTTFGENPFIQADDADPDTPAGRFSAWEYARLRCELLCAP